MEVTDENVKMFFGSEMYSIRNGFIRELWLRIKLDDLGMCRITDILGKEC